MIRYKIDVAEELNRKGYNYKVIKERKLLAQSTITKIKNNENITLDNINRICLMLRIQPSDLFEVVPTNEEKIKYF